MSYDLIRLEVINNVKVVNIKTLIIKYLHFYYDKKVHYR